MKKPTISLTELANQIRTEQWLRSWANNQKKNQKIMQEIVRSVKRSLHEGGGLQGLSQAADEIEGAGMNAEDEKVQVALLQAALEKDGDFSKVDPEDVKQQIATIKENETQPLREVEGFLGGVKLVSTVLGNQALINAIAGGIESATGKKIEPGKVIAAINKISGWVKSISGLFAKGVEKFFGWIAKKLGAGLVGQKVAGYSAMIVITIALAAVSISFFPAAGPGLWGWVLSVTSLIGKGIELVSLGKKVWDTVTKNKAEVEAGAEGGAQPAMA